MRRDVRTSDEWNALIVSIRQFIDDVTGQHEEFEVGNRVSDIFVTHHPPSYHTDNLEQRSEKEARDVAAHK